MGMSPLNGFEEVNIFKNDGEVIHITTPKSKYTFLVNLFSSRSLFLFSFSPSINPFKHLCRQWHS